MKKYKLSKYNYFKQFDETTIIACNLVNKVFFGLEISKYYLIIDNSSNLLMLKEINPNLFSALFKLGVIIDSEINEKNKIILKHREQVYNNPLYRLTILPTMDCNFKCWYCYEEHSNDSMSKKMQNNILKYIKQNLIEKQIKLLSLDWFGGEPLLVFEDILYPLSLKIKNLCKKNNINFINGITTNGSLIKSEMITKMNEINLNSFQITLDGHEKDHNQVKKSKISKGNEYQNILKIIFDLCDNIFDLKLLIRINYSPKNIIELNKIIEDIPISYRNKFSIAFQQVWQTQDNPLDNEIQTIIKDFIESGFIVDKPNIDNSFYKCYADVTNQVVISPNGKIFKCTARDFANNQADGQMNNDGSIEWYSSYYDRQSKTTIEYEKCIDCNLLPACWGPCSQKLLEYKEGDFEKICNYLGVEKTIENCMNDFYINRVLNPIEK